MKGGRASPVPRQTCPLRRDEAPTLFFVRQFLRKTVLHTGDVPPLCLALALGPPDLEARCRRPETCLSQGLRAWGAPASADCHGRLWDRCLARRLVYLPVYAWQSPPIGGTVFQSRFISERQIGSFSLSRAIVR